MKDKTPIKVQILGFLNLITAGEATPKELETFTEDLVKIVEPYYIEQGGEKGLTFKRLQQEHTAWAEKNFPNNKPYHPLLGLVEEVGELTHARLKLEQGIRLDENHRAKQIDAIGDIVLYLADYCRCNNIDLELAVTTAWAVVSKRDWVKEKIGEEPYAA